MKRNIIIFIVCILITVGLNYFSKQDYLAYSNLSYNITKVINTQTGNYTLSVNNLNNIILMSSSSAQVITLPLNASTTIPVGTELEILQVGSGSVSFATSTGVTLYSRGNLYAIGVQYAGAQLIKTDTDTWYLIGALN